MKRWRLLSVSLMGLSLVGLISVVNPTKVVLAEEKVVTHEHVDEPTQVLMNEIAKRVNNILDGILAGSFKYVAQEAGAIVDQSYKVNATFFPVDPKENKWFKRAKIDPNDSEKIANNQQETFKSFTNMIEKTCFECHKTAREGQ